MYGATPRYLFRVHDWRNDIVTLGEVPGSFVYEVSEGKLDYTWPAQVNKLLRDGGHDLILSIGQIVPHEVVGMAGYNKNIFVGTGGSIGIHRSHFLGAVYGMERMMGRADTPVRRVLNYASDHFAKQSADRLRPDRRRQEFRRQTGHSRPLHRRRHRMLRTRGSTKPQGELQDDGPRDQEGSSLSRSPRIQEHMAGQQERLPHPNGA